jgi:hypothetical protein
MNFGVPLRVGLSCFADRPPAYSESGTSENQVCEYLCDVLIMDRFIARMNHRMWCTCRGCLEFCGFLAAWSVFIAVYELGN